MISLVLQVFRSLFNILLIKKLETELKFSDGLVEIDEQVVTSLAQEKYEKWMQQYQHEIKRAIDRALKGENEDIRTVCKKNCRK